MSNYKRIMPLTLVLFATLIGGTAAQKEAAQQQTPHWEVLQRQFKEMLSEDAMAAPFSRIDKLKQILKKEDISDQELATAALKFMSQNENAGDEILLVTYAVMMSATKPVDLAQVWTAALAAKDEKSRDSATTLLEFLEHYRSEKPNFRLYTPLLTGRTDDMPRALVEYMYEHDPRQAFLTIVDATRNVSPQNKQASDQRERDLLFAHHMIEHAKWFLSNNYQEGREEAIKVAIQQLTKLANAPEWWVRLYVVKIIVDCDELRTPAILSKLADDKNAAVREAVQSLKQNQTPTMRQP